MSNEKNKTIFRTSHNIENPFGQISKKAIADKNLSDSALGKLVRMLANPDNWEFYESDLNKRFPKNKPADNKRAITELREGGYILKYRYKEVKTGKFKWETRVFESPEEEVIQKYLEQLGEEKIASAKKQATWKAKEEAKKIEQPPEEKPQPKNEVMDKPEEKELEKPQPQNEVMENSMEKPQPQNEVMEENQKLSTENQKNHNPQNHVMDNHNMDNHNMDNGVIYLDKPNLNKLTNIDSREDRANLPSLPIDLWNNILEVIKNELTETPFKTWILSIKFKDYKDNKLVLEVPNDFSKGIINTRYKDKIEKAFKVVTNSVPVIEINIKETA